MRFLSLVLVLIILWIEGSTAVCSDQGIFTNPEDNLCQTYIYCFRLPDGVFIEKTYSCPNGTLFNPVTKLCKQNYQCVPPTVSTSSPEEITSFECTSQGRFPETNDATCSRYFFCYYLPTGRYIIMNYTCPGGTKFDPKLQTCTSRFKCTSLVTTVSYSPMPVVSESSSTPLMPVVPGSYSCSQQGRFPVVKDVTCRSYYYCLYIPGGSFTQQIYLCPSDLKFNPITQICSQDYQCTPPTTPSTIKSSTITSTTKSSSTTGAQISEESTTINEAETTARFDSVCSSAGRFPDLTDLTCRTYFYCIQISNGSLAFQTYRCPKDANFNPKIQICDNTYKCLSGKLISTNIESTTFSILNTTLVEETREISEVKTIENSQSICPQEITQLTNSFTSSENTSTVSTSSEEEATAISIVKSTATKKYSFFSEGTQEIESLTNKVTSERDLITASSSMTTDMVDNACKTVGRFPDMSDDTCKSYILCILGPDEKLLSFKYKCEFNELFDPNLEKCSAAYNCHGDSGCTSTGIPRDYSTNLSDDV